MNSLHSRRSFLGAALRGAALLSMAPRWARASLFPAPAEGAVVERACHTMGSTLHITALAESRAQAIEAISAAFAEVNRLDRLLSVYRADSTISKINRAAGRNAVAVEDEVLAAITRGLAYTRQLGGEFDITLEPLMRAWGFRAEQGLECSPPSDGELLRMLEAVGPDQVECNTAERTVGLHSSACALDLGGIGVGFALDRAAAVLRAWGIENAFINHSGDAYALGCPPESEGWPIGIPDPLNPRRLHLSCAIANRAVSTSGSYENSRRHGGRTYGHLLNPTTGRPVEAHLSATVIAGSSLDADVLSTAAFCSTAPGAMEACADHAQAEVIRLDPTISEGFVRSHHVPPGQCRTPLHILEG